MAIGLTDCHFSWEKSLVEFLRKVNFEKFLRKENFEGFLRKENFEGFLRENIEEKC